MLFETTGVEAARGASGAERPGWERWGALAGVAYVVLAIAAIVVGVASGTPVTTLGSSADEVARAYDGTAGTGVWVGFYAQLVAFLLLIVFVVRLAAAVRGAAGGGDAAGAVVLVAGGVLVALYVVSVAIRAALVHRAGPDLDPSVAAVVSDAGVGLYVASWAVQAALLAAVASVARRPGPFAGWVGRVAAPLAAAQLAAVALATSEVAELLTSVGFTVWLLAAAIVLVRSERARGTAPTRGAASQRRSVF